MSYKFTSLVKEDHGQPLFGVQFNWFLEEKYFASVGSNRATVYQCNDDGSITALQAYCDSDPEENFYTCAWSYDTETGESLLVVAGFKGIIRVIETSHVTCRASYSGHGHAINELKVHPLDPRLLLSASKDHALRLWNLKTSVCIAIFGGVEGHRDEVLSADFDFTGSRILSCGMDHALKLWEMDMPKLKQAIKDSFEYQRSSKKDIHRNYVDCVSWFGQLALSKSCENCVVLWQPPAKDEQTTSPFVLHKWEVSHCDIWFIRFCVDYHNELLALGNTAGKIFIWDLKNDEATRKKSPPLSHSKCVTAVRQVSFSKDASTLISVCDNGTVWRWDKKEQKK